MISETPSPPYFAVIFTSLRTDADGDYAETADELLARASRQPGFLGAERARSPDGWGISVTYWESLDAIEAWENDAAHVAAKRLGREKWIRAYALRVARVDRSSRWEADAPGG